MMEPVERKRLEYSERGSRRLPTITIDAPVRSEDVAKARAILRRAVQDWRIAIVTLKPDGTMTAFKPGERDKISKWWLGTYGPGFTTKMIRGDIEFQLVEIRKYLGIREKWER